MLQSAVAYYVMRNEKRKGFMSFKRNDSGGFTFRSGATKKTTSYSSFWNDNDSSSVDELLGLDVEIKKGKDPIELASLRLGCYELKHHPDTPFKVVISEYVDLAHEFGAESGEKFVNSILDKIAKGLA